VASHSYLGLKVIIEDYITDQQFQEQLILASLWGFGLLGVSVVGAVIILFFRV
jgi:succinate dehydrogenase hydrophobic anchor subunit